MATAELLQNIREGNRRKSVSEDVYHHTLEQCYKELQAQYGERAAVFDPDKHLRVASFETVEEFRNTRRISMEELGLATPEQISPVGVSDPFPLFTDEAVDIMKLEVLQKETFLRFARSSFNASSGESFDCVVRGFVTENDKVVTPFIHSAWTHPRTMELVSQMAGVELEVIMNYEIAHTNIGFGGAEEATDEIPAIVGWHYDSYPFVCVLMLSDTTNMVGGETYLRKGDGELAKVDGPRKGYAAVLQGRLIQHLAPKPQGCHERITMVTSYRAKNPLLADGLVLSTVKPEVNYGSRYGDFYPEWVSYRANVLKQRLDSVLARPFNKEAAIAELQSIAGYLEATWKEMDVLPEEWAAIARRET